MNGTLGSASSGICTEYFDTDTGMTIYLVFFRTGLSYYDIKKTQKNT